MARFLEHYANRLLSPFVERCDDGSGVQFKGGSIHGSQVHLKCDALERALQGNADQPPLKLSLAHINKLQIDVPWTLSGDIEIAIDEMSVVVVQRDMRGTAGSLMELTENRVRIWMQHLFMAIKDGDSKLRFSNEEASALCQAEITRDRSKDNARRPKEGVGRRTSKLLLSMLRKLLGRCRPPRALLVGRERAVCAPRRRVGAGRHTDGGVAAGWLLVAGARARAGFGNAASAVLLSRCSAAAELSALLGPHGSVL
mgnify:CR=1 FL=1